jgi:hypothetical protein
MKKRLTREEEFDILKLVLDKFLWLGVLIMGYGFYKLISSVGIAEGLSILVAGAIILVIFMIILVKEYEFIK